MSNISKRVCPKAIERWKPSNWDEMIGNKSIKSLFAGSIRNQGKGPNALITGGSGTCKSVSTELFKRTISCANYSADMKGPCNNCFDCRRYDSCNGNHGLWASRRDSCGLVLPTIHIRTFDCSNVSWAEIEEDIRELSKDDENVIFHLDEAHMLGRSKSDERMCILMDRSSALFIATTSNPSCLSEAVKRRFSRPVKTSLPTNEELISFIHRRCQEFGIVIEDDSLPAIVAVRCQNYVSDCLGILSYVAAEYDYTLNLESIREFNFRLDSVKS